MKDFLENIVKNIVEDPNSVVVTETNDNGKITLLIKVADSDMGRVIGKDGKVINAIRMILRVMAIRQNVRVRIDIEDDKKISDENQTEVPAAPPIEPVLQQMEAPVVEPVAPQVQAATPPQVETTQPEVAPTAADFVGQPGQTTVIDNSSN